MAEDFNEILPPHDQSGLPLSLVRFRTFNDCHLMDWALVGEKISIFMHTWLPGSNYYRLNHNSSNTNMSAVVELIDNVNRDWNKELIINTFSAADVARILQIPLATERHDDIVVWRGEPSGEFSVRSAYKLLHRGNFDPTLDELQATSKKFYKKL
ncbi:hypothetical protein Gotur_021788 [Gossypium turneri]